VSTSSQPEPQAEQDLLLPPAIRILHQSLLLREDQGVLRNRHIAIIVTFHTLKCLARPPWPPTIRKEVSGGVNIDAEDSDYIMQPRAGTRQRLPGQKHLIFDAS
jgi:hypothetical protein